MNTVKDWLISSLGAFGLIIYYALMITIAFIPFCFLPIPLWVALVICLILQFIPVLYNITAPVAWIWSFIIVVREPISAINVVYYVCLAIWILTVVVPIIYQITKN